MAWFRGLKADWGEYCYFAKMEAHYEGVPYKRPSFLRWLYIRFLGGKDWFSHLLEKTVCRYRGHDWIDESYGGPDYGCMAGTCKRCGYSFHHQLY